MEITAIKQQLSLAQVIKHYGLKPDRQNRLCCPFHEDKTPSLQLYYKTQTAYCFSAGCSTHGRSMDVIDFIMHMEKCSKHEAIIKAEGLISQSPSTHSQVQANDRQLPIPPSGGGGAVFLERMFTYFKNAVHNSKPAQEYLEKRCLQWKSALLEKGGVGYNAGQFHHGARRDENLIAQCLQYGLLLDKNLTSRTGEKAYGIFGNQSIVFALRNGKNEITGLYFRSAITPLSGEKEGAAKHFYLKDRQGLYPGYPDKGKKKLLLTESIIDAASLLQIEAIAKEYNILACYGTNGLTPEHQQAIKEWLQTPSSDGQGEAVFFFDNDSAGKEAVKKYAAMLKAEYPNLTITNVTPINKDVNETLQAHNDTTVFIDLLHTRSHDFSFSTEASPPPERGIFEVPPSEGFREAIPPSGGGGALVQLSPYKLRYESDTAIYCVQGGLPKTPDNMKIMLVIENKASGYKARNKTDLYEDRQTEKLCSDVSERLNLRKDLLEADLYTLTGLLEQHIENSRLSNSAEDEVSETGIILSAKERAELEAFARKPKLVRRINDLLGASGIMGEERNRIFLLIIAVSHKMPETLHALIQGSSGSGKTRLLRQISDCMPADRVTRFTRISDKALYHYPENYFTNRLLVIEDADGLSEEAELAFRELQSGGELRSSLSIKLENGQHTGGEKVVKGPVATLSCTTRGELYEDNMSRVFLIAIDESAEQTKRIIHYQNAVAAGMINREEEEKTRRFLQKIVSILEPCRVINPYAAQILLPEEAHKIRRLNDLFQSFVKMVTVINQYQRKRDEKKRLVTEIEDMETAIHIMFESIVLKVDELDGSLRQFFERLKIYLQKQNKDNCKTAEFTLREIRQALKLSKTQVFRYANDLCALEYIRQSGGYSNKGYSYKITWWDNYQSLREKIKQSLEQQLKVLKSGTLRNTTERYRNATGTLQPA
jgi:DNA primase